MAIGVGRCGPAAHERPVLILAPLAVAAQTVGEGLDIGVHVTLCRTGSDVRDGINITNYDRPHHFDCSPSSMVLFWMSRHASSTTTQNQRRFWRRLSKRGSSCARLPHQHQTIGLSLALMPSSWVFARARNAG